MTRARRLTIVAASAALAVAALAGCSNASAGAAATLGDTRISEQQLATEVQAVQVAKGQPANAPDESLTQQTLGRLITMELLDRLTEREGIVVTQGMVDEQLANYEGQAGDRQKLEQLFIEQNVAPSQLESIVRLQVQAQQLGIKLNPRGSADEQGQAVFDAASALSKELQTTVSPRFGLWDPAALRVGGVASDLAVPPTAG